MKNFLNNIRDTFNNENVDNKKTIAFFAFYVVFFAILFGSLFWGGNKDFLHQEYEKGDSTINNGVITKNYVFDYKITIDGVLHDYYGKRYENTEKFKYNNREYYRDGQDFFVNQDLWIKSDNPYQFYELYDFDNLTNIFMQLTYLSKQELENGSEEFHYVISSNSLNKILYNEDTDYDEEVDSIDILSNKNNKIEKITYHLDHFCSHRENCQNTLLIELNFEMFDDVEEIDNPIE